MNRDRARELLPIIEAFANGEDIERKDTGSDKWFNEIGPMWRGENEYRIKPSPREIWIHDALEYRLEAEMEVDEYISFRDGFAGAHKHRWTKFVEVTDE